MRSTLRARLVALLAILATLPAAAEEVWKTYVNDRFGTVVEYPDIFADLDRPPDNSDGQTFRTGDRSARLAAYGFYNVEEETMRQLMLRQKQDGVSYSYSAATRGAFTLSGTRAGRVFYTRCIVSAQSSDTVNCVELEYPESEVRRWDAIVARVSRSLRSQAPS